MLQIQRDRGQLWKLPQIAGDRQGGEPEGKTFEAQGHPRFVDPFQGPSSEAYQMQGERIRRDQKVGVPAAELDEGI